MQWGKSWNVSQGVAVPNKYLVSTYYVPSTVLGVDELGMNKTSKILVLMELTLQLGVGKNVQVNTWISKITSGSDKHYGGKKIACGDRAGRCEGDTVWGAEPRLSFGNGGSLFLFSHRSMEQ